MAKHHEFKEQTSKGYLNGRERDNARREMTRGEKKFQYRSARAARIAYHNAKSVAPGFDD